MSSRSSYRRSSRSALSSHWPTISPARCGCRSCSTRCRIASRLCSSLRCWHCLFHSNDDVELNSLAAVDVDLAGLQEGKALAWGEAVELGDEIGRADAVRGEEIVMHRDEHVRVEPAADRGHLAHVQVADDVLLLAEVVTAVDRQQRQVKVLAFERAHDFRYEDRVAGMVKRDAASLDEKAHPARMAARIHFIGVVRGR